LVKNIGWRNSFRVNAAFGIFTAAIVFFISEPERGKYNSLAKKLQVKELQKPVSRTRRIIKDVKIILSSPIGII
jgi:hypothetical protein